MEQDTIIIDTSVLLVLLKVPSFFEDKDHEGVAAQFLEYTNNTEKINMIMPITTLIESGNHIAYISNHKKQHYVKKFSKILSDIYEDEAPWKYYGHSISKEMFYDISITYKDYALRKVGMGDLCIIKVFEEIKNSVPMNGKLKIWTLDSDLQGYEEVIKTLER